MSVEGGLKHGFRVFALSRQKDEVAIYCHKETYEKSRF